MPSWFPFFNSPEIGEHFVSDFIAPGNENIVVTFYHKFKDGRDLVNSKQKEGYKYIGTKKCNTPY